MKDIQSTFEAIYIKESDVIFRFCLLRVSNRETALDIVQETFLRLWKQMQEDKDILNERALLFTIARHLIIDWYRKKKSFSLDAMVLNNSNNDERETSFDILDEETTFANLEIGAEGRYLIDQINKLGDTYRESIYLRYVEDLSPGEIGKIMGITPNAASVRINRGLVELKKIVEYGKQ
ncbi:MAG: RNA polymerase sigma factor [Candidatus Nomurabacteria bacterium]|nr:RNA polymerase sigma factor [Candidatus Nomurabacteria bacterium]